MLPSFLRVLPVVALLAIAASSTLSDAHAQTSSGRVRVVHASPDAPPVDVYVNGEKAVSGLAFPEATGYLDLPAGAYEVQVFPSPSDGTGTPVLEAALTVEPNRDYTVLAVGRLSDGSLELLPLVDAYTQPSQENAHVRFIHASPDAPAVDIVVRGTGTAVFSNVAFKDATDYVRVPAGTYDLDVRIAGTETVALPLDDVRLDAGTVYTVVAVGLAGEGSLRAVPLVDAEAPAPPHTGTGLAPATGEPVRDRLWLPLAAAAGLTALALAAALYVQHSPHRRGS